MNGIDPVSTNRAAAKALAENETLKILCETLYGQRLSVYVDSLGSLSGAKSDTIKQFLSLHGLMSITPYVVIGALSHNDGPVTNGDECELGAIICADASTTIDGMYQNTAFPEAADDLVFEFGNADRLVQLVEGIKSSLVESNIPGQIQKFSTAYNSGEQYPLQYAEMTLTIQSVQTF